MKMSKKIYYVMATSVISMAFSAYTAQDRALYLKNISDAVTNPGLCKIPNPSLYSSGKDLYNSFKKLEKNGVETDDRVLYYLVCGDYIQTVDSTKYAELFGQLSTLQKAAPKTRVILAAARNPKIGCSTAGLLGGELANLSDTNKALLCEACYNKKLPVAGTDKKVGMFEQTADWNAIMAVCGKPAQQEICNKQYQDSFVAGSFKQNLINACKNRTGL